MRDTLFMTENEYQKAGTRVNIRLSTPDGFLVLITRDERQHREGFRFFLFDRGQNLCVDDDRHFKTAEHVLAAIADMYDLTPAEFLAQSNW